MATMADEAGTTAGITRPFRREELPELMPVDERPTRGDPLPRPMLRHIPLASMLSHLAGYRPPEPSAYEGPGGLAIFDFVFRKAVGRFAEEPPPLLPIQDMDGMVGGLPPLRLEHFHRDFAGVDHQTPRENLALAIQLKTDTLVLFVPIAPGIDQQTAEDLVQQLRGREADFIDLELIEMQMRSDGDLSRDIECAWVMAPPDELGAWFVEQQIEPAALMMLRRAGAWDRLRAELANATPHWMPPFDQESFEKAVADGLTADPARLDALFEQVLVHLQTMPSYQEPRWERSVDEICALLDPLSRARPERMAVVVTVARYELAAEAAVELSRETVCLGVSLDLHQAHALHAEVTQDPTPFVALEESEEWFEMVVETAMVPAAALSRLGASTARRKPAGYEAFAARINSIAVDTASAERREGMVH